MNNSDAHLPKGYMKPNQFQSAWKKLNSSQKGTLISIFVLALMLPIAVFASYFQNNVSSRAALKPRTYMATPVVNQAVKFPNEEANNSYLVTPPDPDNNGAFFDTGSPFTIEAWVKIPKPLSGTYIKNYTLLMLTKPQSPTDYGYIFRLTLETQETTGVTRPKFTALKNTYDNNINSNYISVISNSEAKNSIPPDTWTHIAITSYSENQQCFLRLYLNGAFIDGAGNSAPNCAISNQNPQKLLLAKYPDGAGGIDGYYYPGAMDELRISNTVRYTQNFTPPTTPFESDNNTISLWHFDGNTQDSSGHSFHFTNVGKVGYINVEYPLPATPTTNPTGIEPSPSITGIPVTPSIIPSKVPSPTSVPTITNHPPVITSTFLPKGQVGRPYNAIISGMDQDIGDTLQMEIVNLPPGVSKGQCQTTNTRVKYIRCLIKGSPTLAGIYPVNVKLTDNFGGVATKILSLTIINPNKFDEPLQKE
ncbi:LamG domain-containing protein [Candidatus Gottesmanbacteria bacterium]|nr:LamG domain-containing protein [Candidatus Gottesmanbacteria bacterium]